ncbi:F0F1 ATP synthase subunit B family protein [Silvibacterium acidisoli]|uniref:F0F1 ATP synthase subunit B family protein n=1 Tax=Acidobacteriaceae bacterium ZG23-2 TaxID=2883246 RepID=UPI00406BE820
MKKNLNVKFLVLLLASFFVLTTANGFARAQEAPAATDASGAQKDSSQPAAEDSEKEMDSFRHAAPVVALANKTGMPVETMAKIFEDLNSGILIAVILFFVLKIVPKTFRKRSETLQQQLVEARTATAHANERLAVVEERLSKLGVEIDSIREQSERDSAGDEKRIQEALEEERKRIVASAEQDIAAAQSAAQRGLKKFAAELALERAKQQIHLGVEGDRALIHSFGESLKGDRN